MIIYQSMAKPAAAVVWETITIREMAETMQDMAANNEATTPENLMLRGYSSADITRYGLPAANLARKRAVKAVM